MRFSEYGIICLEEDCSPVAAENRSLPYDSVLVEYKHPSGEVKYDLVRSFNKSKIFDLYYDTYGNCLIKFHRTEGRVNPKLYQPPKKK